MKKKCIYCKKVFEKPKFISIKVWKNKSKYCSRKCYKEHLKTFKKEKANAYKGDKAKHSAIHWWLFHNYGKANKCDNRNDNILDFKCSNISKKYHWALKKDKKHSHNRDNYLMLCVSCHVKYDFTEDKREKLRIISLGNKNACISE